MARYDVRFQLQVGSKEINSTNYHSDREPCSKREAHQCLANLWSREKNYFGDDGWNRSFEEAIDKANRAVDSARNVSAAQNRNFYSAPFRHKDETYRVDIAVEAGDGHFN